MLEYMHHDPVHRKYHHNQLTFGAALRVHRELRAAALARRGGPRQALAARQDARRRLAAASPTCACSTASCGPTRARSCCSWAASSASADEWNHDTQPRLVAAGHRPVPSRRPAARAGPQPRLPRTSRLSTRSTSSRPASSGSTAATGSRAWSRSAALPQGGGAARVRVQLHPGAAHRLPGRRPRAGYYREILNTDAALYGGGDVGLARHAARVAHVAAAVEGRVGVEDLAVVAGARGPRPGSRCGPPG